MNQVPVQVLDQQLLEENSTNYADATTGPVTVTLPIGGGGHRVSVQKVDASANPVTVVGLLRGVQKTVVLEGQFDMVLLESDRQGWWWIQGSHRSAASLSATYVPLLTAAGTFTWNPDGTIATQTIGGVTTTFAWNVDGTLNTETRNGVTRTYAYNTNGTLASVA